MTRVRKLNVILTIDDSEVPKFMNLGYDVIDEQGEILRKAIPTDIGTLRHFYVEHMKQIAELKAENEKLNKKLKKLQKSVKTDE